MGGAARRRVRKHEAWTAAQRSGKPWTLHADEQTRAILDECSARQPLGLSWYSLRHQIGAELKEAVSTGAIAPEEAAAVMGHRSSLSLSYYGTRSRARGGRKFRGKAAEDVRVVPVSHAQKAKARTERKTGKSIKAGQTLTAKARPAAKPKARPATSPRPWDYKPPTVPKAPKPPR